MPLTPGQRACVETLDAPVAVCAGAGSGKTFTLTRRIVHAIESGFANGIDEVLAITYTTKAADEIKSRVKGALAAAGLTEQALRVDGAWISTIHGMCSRILREHALEFGIDPAFSVLDDPLAQRLRNAALEETLAAASDMVSPGSLDALFAEYTVRSSGRNDISIERMLDVLVDAASAHPRGLDALATGPAAQPPAVVLARAGACLDVVAKLAGDASSSPTSKNFIAAAEESVRAARRALDEGTDAQEAMEIIACMPLPPLGIGKKDGPYRRAAAETRETLAECLLEARLAAAEPIRDDLISLACLVCETYERMKREAAALDNNDLLVYVARAFEEHPDIARAYQGRFKVVMVDEFQDTDPLQIDMIRRIAGEGWQLLCTVGDAQQSIYRFRGADVAAFRRHVADVGQRNPAGTISLSENFRSHADVLAFVDRVFEQPSAFGGSFMSLVPARDERRVRTPLLGAGPRIDVVAVSYPQRGVGARTACEAEAAEIADRFAALRDAGHAAGDMALLLGTMGNADIFASALRARGLPCVLLKGSVFNKMPEVNTMVQLAWALANPSHTTALFEVLSSELFSLTADDFITLSTFYDEKRGIDRRRGIAKGLREIAALCAARAAELPASDECAAARSARDEGGYAASSRLEAAARLFLHADSLVGKRPLSRIMADLVRDSGWLSRLEKGGAEGQAKAGNILKALRVVEDLERSEPLGPLGTARRFAHAVETAKETPGALATSGGDFVRIMTVHASKGLEFPIVAVAEMEPPRTHSGKLACSVVGDVVLASLDVGTSAEKVSEKSFFHKASSFSPYEDCSEEEIERALSSAPTAAHFRAALKVYEAAGNRQERKRLMYVATTRAKEALVIAMRGMETKDGGPLGRTAADGACADVVHALFPDGHYAQGTTFVDFGGSLPARASLITLAPASAASADGEQQDVADALAPAPAPEPDPDPEPESDPARESAVSVVAEASSGPDAAGFAAVAAVPMQDAAKIERTWAVYEPAELPDPADLPFSPARADVFSYSSLSAAAHESASTLADEPASQDFCEVSHPHPDVSFGQSPFGEGDALAWDAVCASLSDEDKATDLGTAFHRIAQLSVMARSTRDTGCLRRPSPGRIEALCRSSQIRGTARDRLNAALDRWFTSDLAHAVSLWPKLEAEVPFFVKIDIDGHEHFLEGEIDLLATEGDPEEPEPPDASRASRAPGGSSAALIIDYKTGGHANECPDEVRGKHRLQATCYAYALLRQGYAKADAVFVRVERDGTSHAVDGFDGRIDALGDGALPPSAQGRLRQRSLAARRDGEVFPQVADNEKGPDDHSEPQYACYSFSADDLDGLVAEIAAAYRLSR